jgi:hypothetical protein
MAENSTGALAITGVVVRNTTECTWITKRVITTHGVKRLMIFVLLEDLKRNLHLERQPLFLHQHLLKLTLNDKLRNAFCTKAGLSADEVDLIWQDAQGNE